MICFIHHTFTISSPNSRTIKQRAYSVAIRVAKSCLYCSCSWSCSPACSVAIGVAESCMYFSCSWSCSPAVLWPLVWRNRACTVAVREAVRLFNERKKNTSGQKRQADGQGWERRKRKSTNWMIIIQRNLINISEYGERDFEDRTIFGP